MAKNPNLTVSVNSQQFQQFARQFAALSGQMRQMNQQFAQINTTLQRTTVTSRMLNTSFQVGLNFLKGMGSAVGKITGHFLKWSVIIGGVTTLLGMGGGLFGIDRLAQSILTKRRQVLGLGGSANYGRVQASTIYNQSYLDNPMGSLQAVQRGLGGSSDELRGLAAAGIPFGTKMSSTEVLDKIIDKTMEVVKRAAPGTELMVTKAYGLDKFLSESDIMRMVTEEGRKEILEKRELIKAHEKELQLSPKAQKGWADLELQFQIARASMQTIFGEKLRDLAKPLGRLSEGFAHLIKVLMDSPTVQKVMKRLADGIDWLAKKLKDLTEDDIKKFIDKIKEWLPTLEEFKNAMKGFVSALQTVVSVLNTLFPQKSPLASAAQAAGAGSVHNWLDKHLTPAGKKLLNFDSGLKPTQAPTAQSPSTPQSSSAAAPAPTSSASSKSAASFLSPNIGGGLVGGAGATDSNLFNPGSFAGVKSGLTAPSATAPPSPSAANGLSPQPSFSDRFGNWSGSSDTPQKGGSRPGPLSMNNWQMNRTASLVVRNVPGANIFMSAQGMTG
jgi:hypothetical protein